MPQGYPPEAAVRYFADCLCFIGNPS